MIGTFAYVTARSFKNRFLSQLRRLRQPQYLIASVLGVGYFGWLLTKGMGQGLFARVGGSASGSQEQVVVFVLSSLIYLVLVLPWAFPSAEAGVVFSEPEIDFLFSAPLTRRQVLVFKVLRSQSRLLFTALMGWILGTHGRANFPGLWIMLISLHLYLMFVSFARARLRVAGIGFLRRLGVVLVLVGGTAWALVRSLAPVYHSATGPFEDFQSTAVLFPGIGEALASGPIRYFLAFPRIFASAVLAHGTIETLTYCGIVALLGLAFFYVASQLDVAFEDASIKASRRRAEEVATKQERASGRAVVFQRFPAFIQLAETGRPGFGIVWKNSIAAARSVVPLLLLVLTIMIIFPVVAAFVAGPESSYSILMTLGMMGLGFVAVAGPLYFRTDLRTDLRYLETLKVLPIRGREIVLMEVLSTALIMFLFELCFVLMTVMGMSKTLPSDVFDLIVRWSPVAIVLIVPLGVLQITIQNGAALVIPAWVIPERGETAGIERIGRTIALFLAHVLSVAIVLIPAALVFGLVLFLAVLVLGMTPEAGAIASIPAAALIVGEIAFLIHVLGQRFERMEPGDVAAT